MADSLAARRPLDADGMARIITEAMADPAWELSAAPQSPSEFVLGFFTLWASEYDYQPGDVVSVRGGPMRPDRVWRTKAGNPHVPTTFLVVEWPVETWRGPSGVSSGSGSNTRCSASACWRPRPPSNRLSLLWSRRRPHHRGTDRGLPAHDRHAPPPRPGDAYGRRRTPWTHRVPAPRRPFVRRRAAPPSPTRGVRWRPTHGGRARRAPPRADPARRTRLRRAGDARTARESAAAPRAHARTGQKRGAARGRALPGDPLSRDAPGGVPVGEEGGDGRGRVGAGGAGRGVCACDVPHPARPALPLAGLSPTRRDRVAGGPHVAAAGRGGRPVFLAGVRRGYLSTALFHHIL